jgi:hypothetical protein
MIDQIPVSDIQNSVISPIRDILMSVGEVFGVFVVGIGLGIFGAFKKKKINIKWKTQKETKEFQVHTKVHELLTEMRVLLRSSRNLIFQFHNGGKFADGSSIKRFSITHESCSNGTPSMLLESQDVLLTRYMELIDILEKRNNEIITVSSLPDSSLRSILEINNVVYFSVSSLKCEDSLTPMGFLCCHWCDTSEFDRLYEEGIAESSLQDVIESTARSINNHLLHAQK